MSRRRSTVHPVKEVVVALTAAREVVGSRMCR